jgi:hypothetical protein
MMSTEFTKHCEPYKECYVCRRQYYHRKTWFSPFKKNIYKVIYEEWWARRSRGCDPQFIGGKTRTFTASMSGFLLQCVVGCIFYSVGLVVPRKSPCIYYFILKYNICRKKQ